MSEAETKDYQSLYLDQRFETLSQKLDTVIGYQKSYAAEAKNVEERVKVVERLQLTCPIQLVVDDVKGFKAETKKEFEELWQDTEDIRYYKNHPKQIKMLFYGFVFMALITLIPLIEKLFTWFKS
jgi:hypothetical protein